MDASTSARSVSTSEVLSAIRGGRPPLVIDVRRRPGFRAATDMIAGALWRDPGAKAAAYVDAFMHNINWANAARRLPAEQAGAS